MRSCALPPRRPRMTSPSFLVPTRPPWLRDRWKASSTASASPRPSCRRKRSAISLAKCNRNRRLSTSLPPRSKAKRVTGCRRRSATARLVPAQTREQLLELTQKHIRPLIALIDRLNEVGAEDELRVIRQQLTRLVFRAQPLPQRQVAPKSRSARLRAVASPS